VRCAWRGLCYGLRSEHSLRFQASVFALLLVALLILRPEPLWWALVLLASAGVLAAELINTALEHLIDHLHPAVHPQIRIVKDCAAAAVLVMVLGAISAGIALAVHLLRRL
jgi:diacylglycerol kinase (ATP)